MALDIATTRIDDGAFDLIVATNVLLYLDDTGLTLAVANIAGMLAPGGVLLHNEGRPLMPELAALAGLPVKHARTATIARCEARRRSRTRSGCIKSGRSVRRVRRFGGFDRCWFEVQRVRRFLHPARNRLIEPPNRRTPEPVAGAVWVHQKR